MSFCVAVSNDKVLTRESNILYIYNLRHSKHFLIIKYVGLESFLFWFNLVATSSPIVFSTFDYVFLQIFFLTPRFFECIINLKKKIIFLKGKDRNIDSFIILIF